MIFHTLEPGICVASQSQLPSFSFALTFTRQGCRGELLIYLHGVIYFLKLFEVSLINQRFLGKLCQLAVLEFGAQLRASRTLQSNGDFNLDLALKLKVTYYLNLLEI